MFKQAVRLIGAFLFILVGGCTEEKEMGCDTSKVTVIFTDAPDQSEQKLLGGRTVPEETVNYVNEDTLNVRYVPRSIGCDTLVIPTFNGYAELWHKINGGDEALWLLKGGDTVFIAYPPSGRPLLKSLTSAGNTRLYNLPWENARAIHAASSYALKYLVNDPMMKYIYQRFSTEYNRLPEEVINRFTPAFLNLDSLQTVYEAYKKDLSARIDSLSDAGTLSEVYAEWFRKHYLDEGYRLEEVLASDSLMCYAGGARALRTYRNGRKSTVLFDEVVKDTTLSRIARLNLLREAIDGIQNGDYWSGFPDKVVKEYTDRYIALTGDSTRKVRTVNKPNVSVTDGYTYDMVLLGVDGKQYDFADVMAGFKGKVVYVDLWASWCAPCKGEMPHALKLREAYKDKDVVFLYLAVSDREKDWRKEMEVCRTNHLGVNYLVLNTDESVFLKEIKHRLIPRFLLFDRKGHLIDTNAPRPSDEHLRVLLDECLAE